MNGGVFTLLLAMAAQDDMHAVRAALAAADFTSAWELSERQPDELQRHRAKSEVLYRAGDPAGALEQAREGLATAPADLELLFWAAGASLWLEESELANRYTERLAQAAQQARVHQTPEEASAWSEVARDFREQSLIVVRHDAARVRAVARTRALSIAVFVVLLGLIAWAARKGYGRSSNPVS